MLKIPLQIFLIPDSKFRFTVKNRIFKTKIFITAKNFLRHLFQDIFLGKD